MKWFRKIKSFNGKSNCSPYKYKSNHRKKRPRAKASTQAKQLLIRNKTHMKWIAQAKQLLIRNKPQMNRPKSSQEGEEKSRAKKRNDVFCIDTDTYRQAKQANPQITRGAPSIDWTRYYTYCRRPNGHIWQKITQVSSLFFLLGLLFTLFSFYF